MSRGGAEFAEKTEVLFLTNNLCALRVSARNQGLPFLALQLSVRISAQPVSPGRKPNPQRSADCMSAGYSTASKFLLKYTHGAQRMSG